MRFVIEKDYFGDGDFFPYGRLDVNEDVTYLVGCNGAGKSTLMNIMEERLENRGIDFIEFNRVKDDRHSSMDKALFREDFSLLASLALSSEGESLKTDIANRILPQIAHFTEMNGDKPLWIFMDANDSGLSIDAIMQIKKDVIGFILNDCEYEKGLERHFVVSVNQYEFVNGEENCIDVTTGKRVKFGSYDEYKDFILATAKRKEERIERCEG